MFSLLLHRWIRQKLLKPVATRIVNVNVLEFPYPHEMGIESVRFMLIIKFIFKNRPTHKTGLFHAGFLDYMVFEYNNIEISENIRREIIETEK